MVENEGLKLTVPAQLRQLGPFSAVGDELRSPLPLGITPLSRALRLQPEGVELPVPIQLTVPFEYPCLAPFESIDFYQEQDGVWRKLPGGTFQAHQAHIEMTTLRPILLGKSSPTEGELAVSLWCSHSTGELRLLVVPTACRVCTSQGARVAEDWASAGFQCQQQCWPLLPFQVGSHLIVEVTAPGSVQLHQEPFSWQTSTLSLPTSSPDRSAVAVYMSGREQRQLVARFYSQQASPAALPSAPRRDWARPLPPVPRLGQEVLESGTWPEVLLLSRMEEGSHLTLEFPWASQLILKTSLHLLQARATSNPKCLVLSCCCSSRFAKSVVESTNVLFVVHWLDHPQRPRGAPPYEVATTFEALFCEEFERASSRQGGGCLASHFEAFLVARGRLPDQLGDKYGEWANPKQPRLRCWPTDVPLHRVQENPQAAETDGDSSETD